MTFSYNSRVIADSQIVNVNGVRGVGACSLRINVAFNKTAWQEDEVQVNANVLWGTLDVATSSGGIGQLGRVHPDQPAILAPTPLGSVVYQTFSLALSDAQVFALEEMRKGGHVDLKLSLVGTGYSPQYGQQVLVDNVSCHLTTSDWARILGELSYGDVVVLGVHLPFGNESTLLRPAIELLHSANRYLVSGEYDAVVARCRQAIESVQAILGEDSILRPAMSLYPKQKAEMSTFQRELLIQEIVRHYAHPAHHVDGNGSIERYSRSDATFLLTMAAAVITKAAVRAPLGQPSAAGVQAAS